MVNFFSCHAITFPFLVFLASFSFSLRSLLSEIPTNRFSLSLSLSLFLILVSLPCAFPRSKMFIVTTESYASPGLANQRDTYVRTYVISSNVERRTWLSPPFQRRRDGGLGATSLRFSGYWTNLASPGIRRGTVSKFHCFRRMNSTLASISISFFFCFFLFQSDYVISRSRDRSRDVARSINLFTFPLQSLSYYCNYYSD